MLRSENVERLLVSGDTVITQTLEILPLTKQLTKYDFYHWQSTAGTISLLRLDVLDSVSGSVVPHQTKIIEKTTTSLRILAEFKNLGPRNPLKLVFEIRSQNYFPNLSKKGLGYTEFLSRYSVDKFTYSLITPKSSHFTSLFLSAIHDRRRRSIRPRVLGGELIFHFGPIKRGENDILKFNIGKKANKPRIRKTTKK